MIRLFTSLGALLLAPPLAAHTGLAPDGVLHRLSHLVGSAPVVSAVAVGVALGAVLGVALALRRGRRRAAAR